MKHVRVEIRPNKVGDHTAAWMLAIIVGYDPAELIFYRRSRAQVERLRNGLLEALQCEAGLDARLAKTYRTRRT